MPVEEAVVGDRGVVGDRQADPVHHGRPDQALCLFSLEVIEGLQAEGHPIFPGATGENITITGLDWSLLRPGLRLRIGQDLEIEVTDYATPCLKNAGWFVGGKFGRISQKRHPGESRWYARVLTGGSLKVGDPIELSG